MKLAELIIEMAANTAHLHSDLEKAGQKVQQFADGVKNALAGLGVGLSIAGLAEAVKEVSEYGEEISRAAAKTGMTTEQISGLRFAAKATGTEFQSLQQGIVMFDKNVAGLSNTNSRAAKALEALGISTKQADGSIRPTHELLLSVAQRFQGMRDGAEKTAIAVALFGRSGAELIPFLDQGASGIQALEQRAKELGVTLSESDTKAAESFHQQIESLSAGIEGLKIKLVSNLFPGLSQLIGLLLQNQYAIRATKDELQMYALAVKAAAYDLSYPIRIFTTPEENKKQLQDYAKQMTDLATDEHSALAQMKADFASLASTSLGDAPFKIPGKTTGGRTKESSPLSVDMPDEDSNPMHGPAMDSYVKHLQDVVRGLYAAQDPLNAYIVKSQELNDALKIGMVTQGEYAKLMEQVWKPITQAPLTELPIGGISPAQLNQMIPTVTALNDKWKGLGDNARLFGVEASEAFAKSIVSGKSFLSSLEGVVKMLEEAILKAYVFSQIESLLGFQSSTSLSGVSLAGGRAGGGGVSAGELYMVGESGPELFAPGASGSIIPNSSLGGQTVNIDARGAQPGVEHQIMRAVRAMQKQQAGQSLVNTHEYMARGGSL